MPSERVFARLSTGHEIAALHAEGDAHWLTRAERVKLASFRNANRRRSWLAGRVLAKQLVLDCGAAGLVEPTDIEIAEEAAVRPAFVSRLSALGLPAAPVGRAQRPSVRVRGVQQPWCLSISHTDTAAAAAVSLDPGVSVGVDLAQSDRFARGFLEVWFSHREQQQLAAADPLEIAARWAVKEAVYKAAQRGESFAPRSIEVLCDRIDLASRSVSGIACRFHGFDLSDVLAVHVQAAADHALALAVLRHAESDEPSRRARQRNNEYAEFAGVPASHPRLVVEAAVHRHDG
jgi:phosphopantetheine--protein transferase-like protein